MATASYQKVDNMVRKYGGRSSALIQVLQDVMTEYGYLPKEALDRVGLRLQVPLSRIYSVATFYKTFSLEPKGEHQIHVCMGTACHVRGAKMIADKIYRDLKLAGEGTTSDKKWSVDEVACVGACAMGPVLVIDGAVHGKMSQAGFDKFMKKFSRAEQAAEESAPAAKADTKKKKPTGKAAKKAVPKKAAKKAALKTKPGKTQKKSKK